jgi:hypothetical protein
MRVQLDIRPNHEGRTLPVIDSISVTDSASGSTLLINGSHFVDVSTVRIGTEPTT